MDLEDKYAVSLKDCPFCGSSDVDLWFGNTMNTDNGMFFAGCLSCGANTPCKQKDEAIDLWNTRVNKESVDFSAKQVEIGVSKIEWTTKWTIKRVANGWAATEPNGHELVFPDDINTKPTGSQEGAWSLADAARFREAESLCRLLRHSFGHWLDKISVGAGGG